MQEREKYSVLTEAQKRLVDTNLNTKFGADVTHRYGSETTYETSLLNEALSKIKGIQHKRDCIHEMLEGDYVLLEDGTYKEIAEVYKNEIQLSGGAGHHSYISPNSKSSFSGSLESGIKRKFILTEERKLGGAWSFLFGSGANMGVCFDINYKVWKGE